MLWVVDQFVLKLWFVFKIQKTKACGSGTTSHGLVWGRSFLPSSLLSLLVIVLILGSGGKPPTANSESTTITHFFCLVVYVSILSI